MHGGNPVAFVEKKNSGVSFLGRGDHLGLRYSGYFGHSSLTACLKEGYIACLVVLNFRTRRYAFTQHNVLLLFNSVIYANCEVCKVLFSYVKLVSLFITFW